MAQIPQINNPITAKNYNYSSRPMDENTEPFDIVKLTGVGGAGGQFSITAAYAHAPAKEISVFDYSQVLFAALWGFLAWGEIPDYLSVIGYVIIIGVAVFRWWYNLRQPDSAPEPTIQERT